MPEWNKKWKAVLVVIIVIAAGARFINIASDPPALKYVLYNGEVQDEGFWAHDARMYVRTGVWPCY